ncbi:hypothetical protein KV697_06085 [Sphingomonas sanguinis]|uniref:hypothetical protein n=1 Tax=Sphingomonas sanguinis TaxID=33051 RepID=UPI001C59E152|nr:hypothetical protein [Sphingomonas sanguinis]QXT36868.1 hypothetical protein KV697_06085 [Sphingomonas sanguinis]
MSTPTPDAVRLAVDYVRQQAERDPVFAKGHLKAYILEARNIVAALDSRAGDAEDGQKHQAFIFDVLEALKPHFPRIAFCFARGTGGIERKDVLAILNGTKALAVDAKCPASPDQADILETIQNAADDWQAMGYATALAEVRDMANVGRALLEALPEGYHYINCPSEIVSDLQNERDEAPARRFLKLVNRIADWTDDEVKAASPEQVRHVARVVRDGADPVYPPFAAPKSGDAA